MKQLYKNYPLKYHARQCLKLVSVIMLFSMIAFSAFCQTIKITGQVTDKEGVVPGVTVMVKGTSTTTVTDVNGKFTINVNTSSSVLVFTIVGYEKLEIPVGNQKVINAKLVTQLNNLNEVVVIGYGTTKKKDLTGAVSTIDATRLENEHPASIQDLLRSNAAGLNVGFNASAAGGGSLQVRGQNTLTAGATPLIVLDGAIYIGSLSDINPEDIQSIDVLKDASAASIYGSQAAEGVIAITSKKGTTEKPVINVNATTGLATMEVNQPVYSPQGFIQWRQDVEASLHATTLPNTPGMYSNPLTSLPAGVTTAQWLAYDASSGDPTSVWLRRIGLTAPEITNYQAGNTTNWYNLSFKNGLRQDYTMSISGKGSNVTYYWSGEYQNNQGIIVGDQFHSYRNRLNLDAKITNFLSVGMNTVFSYRYQNGSILDWGSGTDMSGTIYMPPYANLMNSAGTDYVYLPVGSNNTYSNAFGAQKYTTNPVTNYTLNATLYAHVTLPFGIKLTTNFTPYLDFYQNYNWQNSVWGAYTGEGGYASREQSLTYQWQIDNILSWSKTFNNVHHFDVTLVQNASKFQSWDNKMSNTQFSPSDILGYGNIGAGTVPIITSNDQYSTQAALAARLFYSYNDRYLITANIRRDGNSAFGINNPWATFPGLALGWVFTKESFIKADWLDFGKLRLSYAVNGNSNIGRYVALSNLGGGQVININSAGTAITTSELFASTMANSGLKWERTAAYNVGLDFTLFKGRLSGSIDAYKSKTTNLLVSRLLPSVLGFSSVIANLGEVDNKGFEISLNSKNINHENFSWNSSATFALNRNTIVHLYGNYVNGVEQNDINNGWFIGQDIKAVWDYKVLGVYQTNQAALAAQYGHQPGDFHLQDTNGDKVYTNDDKQFLGSTTPSFTWSLRNELNFYKNFSFSFMMYSNWGQLVSYNNAKNFNNYLERENFYVQPYWTPANPINNYARLQSNDAGVGYSIWRNGSFIRLDNVSMAYTVPKKFISKYSIQNLKVFATVKNPLFYSPDYKYWDPQNAGPTPRTYTIGLNFTL